jgi:hypothetical protein
VDRYWLLTWTTYGTWLPGDPRGLIGRERGVAGGQAPVDSPGTSLREGVPKLERIARSRMRGPAVWLTPEQAAFCSAISTEPQRSADGNSAPPP